MVYDRFKHRRRSIRLDGYGYSQPGAYFVTICTQNRECVLGDVANGELQLTDFGDVVSKWWIEILNHFPQTDLDEWIIMPNHIHGIIVITTNSRGEVSSPSPKSSPKLGDVIAYFKYQSTKEINSQRGSPGIKFWQRNYYDHIIRNEEDLNRIRDYIYNNPKNWTEDRNHPDNILEEV
ncbi:MAG: transposase [Candidatus Latescibacteria bacterium]|jgi:REP element-mobilizing transposase RayT|nr:transposase [Candidatus Latescibacterota bacterium]